MVDPSRSTAMISIKLKVASTILLVVCSSVFTILFLAFYPTEFNIWQNIAVFLTAGLLTFGVVAVIWIRMIPI
ncbi:hypothetical protein KAU25_04000 [Candidatus Bathyarchaeota archaeon]|nr:hypothetical protein [Candidatus Bathyarchaeota archaeon]